MSLFIALLVAAGTGFIALSYEILWFRAFSFVSGTLPHVFGVVLGFYLIGIALGSWFARRLCGPHRSSRNLVGSIAVLIVLANIVSFLVVPGLAALASFGLWFQVSYVPIGWWNLGYLHVAVAAGLMGATLPLLAHAAIPPDDRAGARLSYLYVANIVGSALGSLATGFWLLDVLPLAALDRMFLVVGTVLGLVLFAAGRPQSPRARISVVAMGLTVLLLATWSPSLHKELFERLLFKGDWEAGSPFKTLQENRHGVIAITEDGVVYGGGMYDGKINADLTDDVNGVVRPWSILATDREPKTALMIGLAMGSWAQVVAHFPSIERLIVIEINPGYEELIPQFPAVASLLDNPKVTLITDDGRRWLHRHPDARFDLIVQNTTYHWRAHMTNLLSQEYLRACRHHLNPGGLLLFNTTNSEHAMLTALDVFPHGVRVKNNMLMSDQPVELDGPRWERRLLEVRLDGRPMFDLSLSEHRQEMDALMALVKTVDGPPGRDTIESRQSLAGRLPGLGARVITDDNMACEW